MIVLGIDVPGPWNGGWAVYNSDKDQVLEHGVFAFTAEQGERATMVEMRTTLNELLARHRFTVVAIEHGFLYRILPWIGAIKMWASFHLKVTWFMITASMAEKAVWGSAIRGEKNGKPIKGKVRKDIIKTRIQHRYSSAAHPLTQHEADAILYAVGAAKRLQQQP